MDELPEWRVPELPLPPTVNGRIVLPVKVSLWNCTPAELAELVRVEIPYNPISNENGGVFAVMAMLEVLPQGDLYDVFAFAKSQGADYVIASILR